MIPVSVGSNSLCLQVFCRKGVFYMYPSEQQVYIELEEAGKRNPGQWIYHSINAGKAAMLIAQKCPGLNPHKAFALGALHDIGRREGIFYMRHIIEGYNYAAKKGWDEVARVCLTHSFPLQDIKTDIQKADITKEQYDFLGDYIKNAEYDDYDKLIILCDCLANSKGFCILERRMVDVARRYGIFQHTLDRWNRYFEIKDYFENKTGCNIYSLLPGIEKTTFI